MKTLGMLLTAICLCLPALAPQALAKWKIPQIRLSQEDLRAMREERMANAMFSRLDDDSSSHERSVSEILASLPFRWPDKLTISAIEAPMVFAGYRELSVPSFSPDVEAVWRSFTIDDACLDSLPARAISPDSLFVGPLLPQEPKPSPNPDALPRQAVADLLDGPMPRWLSEARALRRIGDEARYRLMVRSPQYIDYAYWNLPPVPRIPEIDRSFQAYVRNQWLPLPVRQISGGLMETAKINWLHTFNGGVQFSQAYISPNWYQGGSNNLTLLINLLWNVQLNRIHHPDLLFDNTVSYKLGLTSTPQDTYHDYTISEDLFQWNLKAGLKAFERWFYSVTVQFKTQFFNNYPQNSPDRKASFLSPGDFNAGLGMTYTFENKRKNFKLNASISPVSYNLKTCIDTDIDPTQFNISRGRKVHNEIGSNGEITIDWRIISNISYRSRLFLFSDYHYFQGDWENTLSFAINRFLSTQIYCHLRYDSSSEITSNKWRHWMLKEILSFGISYTFSTKS